MMLNSIHQIELSSRCNLACKYCPHPGLQREKADMPWEVFDKAIGWAAKLGGKELSFTGMGEALLHPEAEGMLMCARLKLPGVWFLLSTNGIVLTDRKDPARAANLIDTLKECNVTVFVSTHRPEIAGEAMSRCAEAGIHVGSNTAFVTSAFDWAGQVKWHGIPAPRTECQYLKQGWGTVLQNGDIVNCCFDAHGLHPFGNVLTDDLYELEMLPIPLCEHCHLKVPTC